MENTNWVGVDTHKDTLACYTGNKFKEFKTTPQGFEKALKWAGEANWAIEGAYCFGKPFANYLITQLLYSDHRRNNKNDGYVARF